MFLHLIFLFKYKNIIVNVYQSSVWPYAGAEKQLALLTMSRLLPKAKSSILFHYYLSFCVEILILLSPLALSGHLGTLSQVFLSNILVNFSKIQRNDFSHRIFRVICCHLCSRQ